MLVQSGFELVKIANKLRASIVQLLQPVGLYVLIEDAIVENFRSIIYVFEPIEHRLPLKRGQLGQRHKIGFKRLALLYNKPLAYL